MNVRKMKKFINKYGVITQEYVRPKGTDPDSDYYGKESYFVGWDSDYFDLNVSSGHQTKRKAYKTIFNIVKLELHNKRSGGTTGQQIY